ncbi:MAG: hypothetical protein EAZ67_11155 [Cytophagales bacterium]|nr:MAG: hypothetical protein EAZ67_11155 [Cytophagales bacterium]
MKSEEHLSSIYNFTQVDNIYSFDTRSLIRYEIIFRPTPYLFADEPLFSSFTYELIIKVAQNNSGYKNPPYDMLVAPTIAAIFTHFYDNAPTTICIYICDSSDGRQELRQAKFDRWFEYFDKDDYTKVDDSIRESDGTTYPVSLIVKQANFYRVAIVLAFFDLTSHYNKDK